MFAMLMSVIAGMLLALVLSTSGMSNLTSYDTAAVLDSPAPEYVYFGSNPTTMAGNITMDLEVNNVVSIEQSLVDVCRQVYWMGEINSCSPLNEAFTWAPFFVGGGGNTGSLNTVLSSTASSTFTCAHPEYYGVYLLQQIYGTSGLTGYNYNLNIYQGGVIQVIGGQPDPCAYANTVYHS